MKILDKYINVILTVLFCIAVFAFWVLRFPSALVYQEQMQMFMFDTEYLLERIIYPGGVARYVAEFIVQFYNNFYLGALFLTLLFLLLQLLVWRIGKRECRNTYNAYPLSFIPAIVLWFAMGNEGVKLTFFIALLYSLIAVWFYPYKESKMCKTVYVALATPVLYYLAGPSVLVFGLYVALKEWGNWILSLGTFLWSIVCIIISIPLVAQPSYRLFYGINYHLMIDEFPTMLYVVMLITVLTCILIAKVPEISNKTTSGALMGGVSGALIGACLLIVPLNYDRNKYDVFEYDVLMRSQQWEKIIKKAEKTPARSPLSAAAYNLALGMTNQMDRAMEFTQNGWSGAFPPFNKNYIASLMTSEVYWHLGLTNTAQRFVFEAMEAIPDNSKSSRIIRRLAETNLVNGQYEVARKYLLLLQKTMFYKGWATRTLALLGDEDAINAHETYGTLRAYHLTEDFMFSEPEIDKVVGQLVMRNNNNNLAIAYLLLLPKLEGNQQKYQMYYNFVMSERQKAYAQQLDSVQIDIPQQPNDSVR